MEAGRTLSPEQKACLESVYTFIWGAVVFFDELSGPNATWRFDLWPPEQKMHIANLHDLGEACKHKLVDSFPELHEWLAEWSRGGVS
jgi:hypothetical protein